MKRSVLACSLAALALAAPAVSHAAEPFTVGEGKAPHLTVDPASGTAHVVWRNDTTKTIQYCRLPRGATACDASATIDGTNSGNGPYGPHILQDGATLRIVQAVYPSNKTVLITSTDGGGTWGAPQEVYKFGEVTTPGEPIFGPEPGTITMAGSNPSSVVWNVKLDGSESAATEHATLPVGASEVQVAPTGDGGLVATGHDGTNASWWRMAPGSDPSVTASWSGPTTIGAGSDARLASGPSGTFLLSSGGVSGNRNLEIRKWTGAGWGAPVVLTTETPYINDVFVSPSGAVTAIWRENDDPNRLQQALSTDGGLTFVVGTLSREGVVMASMDIALAGDNKGFVTYEGVSGGATAQIRVVPVDGPPAPAGSGPGTGSGTGTEVPPLTSKKTAVPGGELSFGVNKACVPANGRIYAKLSFKRFRRNAAGRLVVLKIRSADFFVGAKKAKTDKKAPFVQWLKIANATPGRSYTLKVKVKLATKNKLRSPTKTVSQKITICS